MKHLKRLNTYLIIFGLLITLGITNIYAGGISAYASPSSVKVGSTFSVTVSSSNMMVENLTASCSGCTLINSVSRPTLDKGESQTVTARLDSPGGATVTFSGNGADYATETEGPVSASAYVAAKADAPKETSNTTSGSSSNNKTEKTETPKPETEPKDDPRSKDNDLKSLSVSEGTLSPAFKKSTTSYKVNLGATATSITVKAAANDAKARVSGTGKIKLQAGANEINITVTSEYGTKKTYTIQVYVDEKPLVYTQFNGEKLGVVRNVQGVKVPENFKKTEVKMDGKEIPAWKNEKMDKTIVYLSDAKNNKAFYLYENGKVTSQFTYKKILGRSFYLISVPKDKQVMEGMQFGEIKVDDTKLMGWTFTDKAFQDYTVFMVMDMDGTTRYYQYDKVQNTLQRYSQAAPVTSETYAKQMQAAKDDNQAKTI